LHFLERLNVTQIVTFGLGGYDPSKPNNNIVDVVEVPDIQVPLDAVGVVATLNAVLGVWSLSDAANVAGVTPDDLIREAQAWAIAQQGDN
jgi:hypothetical protein